MWYVYYIICHAYCTVYLHYMRHQHYRETFLVGKWNRLSGSSYAMFRHFSLPVSDLCYTSYIRSYTKTETKSEDEPFTADKSKCKSRHKISPLFFFLSFFSSYSFIFCLFFFLFSLSLSFWCFVFSLTFHLGEIYITFVECVWCVGEMVTGASKCGT